MKKNDEFIIEITGVTAEGSGVGRAEGMAVFIPFTAVGDTARVGIVKVKKTYAYGRLLETITPSPTRVEPDCPVFGKCGGCVFRHMSYDEEKRIKRLRVADAMKRLGGIETEIDEIIGCDEPDGCRNKAQYPVGVPDLIGFYAHNSHRIVPCRDCRLQPESFGKILMVFTEWLQKYKVPVYDEKNGSGILRHIFLRRAPSTGETAVTAVIKGKRLPHAAELISALNAAEVGMTGFILNVNNGDTNVILGDKCETLFGSAEITDVLCGLKFSVSPLSFYQVNSAQAQRLYEKAAQLAALDGNEILLDLYCGAGTIGLSMAKSAKKVVGVEIIPEAVENARLNAEVNGIKNAEFICADAAEAARELAERGLSPDVVVLDPPRKGCDKALLETVAAMKPKRIVYISCNPATLARDCAVFKELSFNTETVVPVDMFPKTAHVESVALLKAK